MSLKPKTEKELINPTEATINVNELASELAHDKLLDTFQGIVWQTDEDDDNSLRYTEEAQEYFNLLYDKYYDFIINYKIR